MIRYIFILLFLPALLTAASEDKSDSVPPTNQSDTAIPITSAVTKSNETFSATVPSVSETTLSSIISSSTVRITSEEPEGTAETATPTGAKTTPTGARTTHTGATTTPTGATTTPTGATTTPTVATEIPTGATAPPTGATKTPTGATAPPTGTTTTPTGSTEAPAGTTEAGSSNYSTTVLDTHASSASIHASTHDIITTFGITDTSPGKEISEPTKPNTATASSTAFSTTTVYSTTAGSFYSSQSTESTSTTATTTENMTPTLSPFLRVQISETNLLLTSSANYFIELQTNHSTEVNETWLVILDASLSSSEKPRVKHQCRPKWNENGKYVMNNETVSWTRLDKVESVLIALYPDESSADQLSVNTLHDFLLYSSNGNVNASLQERFSKLAKQRLIIDHRKLHGLNDISLSRCSDSESANNAAVLTNQSVAKDNICNMTENSPLEMKLTRKSQDCSSVPLPGFGFGSSLAAQVVSDVNNKEQCGFALHMLDVKVNPVCHNQKQEIDITFTVKSAFSEQMSLIQQGYKDFIKQSTLKVDSEVYDVDGCYTNCFPREAPATKSDDSKIRVTVAVVVSCIGVFLVVLLFLILYLRRKRRNILQFRMTRLDEDEDLMEDMDDFVGNQGPTFTNFR